MSVEYETLSTISGVFDEVARGHAEFGLVPIENSVAGGVGETMDALIDRDVQVCGEVLLAVHHHLLGTGPLDELERVCSKPEVFQQCERWLGATGFAGKTVPVASTSAAAELAGAEATTGAIASELQPNSTDFKCSRSTSRTIRRTKPGS